MAALGNRYVFYAMLKYSVSLVIHMEQNRYNIIERLSKGPSHIRQLARDLDMSHMTVKRTLDIMAKANAIDVRKEGRNSVYSIKATIEARSELMKTEHHKLTDLIARHPELRQDIERLQSIHATLIAIFGSYAKKLEKPLSDIDVYVETDKRYIKAQAEQINRKFSVKIGKLNDSPLAREMKKDHVIIKGVERFMEARAAK